MQERRSARWLMSFADLLLLLLAFFVLLHAQKLNPDAVVSSISTAFDPAERAGIEERRFAASALFTPAEAVMEVGARAEIAALAKRWARRGGQVSITSLGRDADSARYDGWELAAARAAAVGRVIREAGLPAGAIEIVMPPNRGRAAARAQALVIRYHPAR